MSNAVTKGRTNYFSVNDGEAFVSEVMALKCEGISIAQGTLENKGKFAILAEYGFPSSTEDEDGEDVDIDFATIVANHLTDGCVAVFQESGFQKMRSIFGNATAINNKHEVKFLNLDAIYDMAKDLGTDITIASY